MLHPPSASRTGKQEVVSTMRRPETAPRKEPAAAGRDRRRRSRAAAIAALAAILGLGLARGLVGRSVPVAQPGPAGSGNLLVNGSFEQPIGGLLTLGPPTSWWQRFQMWWRINNDFNRALINRRQRPVYVPF